MDRSYPRLRLCCLVLGVLLLLFFAVARGFGEVSSRIQVAAFDPHESVDRTLWSAARARAYDAVLRLDLDAPIAVLHIPSLHLEVPVYARDDAIYLNRGVGIISGMHKPGEGGNVGIAGHRDGFFRALKSISKGDRIELRTRTGVHAYHVTSIQVVSPEDRYVLANTVAPSVTLVTCYPFYFIGSAPQRFIVHGDPSD